MFKLLKFEVQKKWKLSLGALAAYFIVYFGFYTKFKLEGDFTLDSLGMKLVFFVLLATALFVFSMISAVNNLRLEAKHRTRDLYFSVPISAYKKIGAKVIVSFVEIVTASLIALTTPILAIEGLAKTDEISKFFLQIFDMPTGVLIFAILISLVEMIMSLLIIYLSFAVFRSFFSQVKFGGLITVVIYIVLSIVIGQIGSMAFAGMSTLSQTDVAMWVSLGLYSLMTAVVFVIIGYLFEHRVSFD